MQIIGRLCEKLSGRGSFEERNEKVIAMIRKIDTANNKLYDAYVELTHSRMLFAEGEDYETERKLESIGKELLSVYRSNVGIEVQIPRGWRLVE